MRSDIDFFMLAVLPIEYPIIYFSPEGKSLDNKITRPTHTVSNEYSKKKKSGASVKKEFLYPGDHFPHINGILFSEASNLQQLLGSSSSAFNDSTNTPHIFQNYKSRNLPKSLTDSFYLHKFKDNELTVSLETIPPKMIVPLQPLV